MRQSAWRSWALFLAAAALAPAARADGPGLGNLSYAADQTFVPLGFFENRDGPNGSNVVIMTRGYLMVLFAHDSGRPPGELAFFDVSNPRAPVNRHHIENGDTDQFREAHSMPVALIGGKEYVALQSVSGMQVWDVTDPLNAFKAGSVNLPNVTGGDYDNVAWQATWHGNYLYVAGSNQGVYVVDARNPAAPQFITQIPTSKLGGFRIGPIFALGNYLFVSNMDQNGAFSIADISDETDAVLLDSVDRLPRTYSFLPAGDRIYGAGRDGHFTIHSFDDPTNITEISIATIGQDSLYVAYADGHVFSGRQNNFVKIDLSNERNPVIVGEGALGRDHPDHGQVTPMGNLIYVGNDHETGSALFAHQTRSDTTPPRIDKIYPVDGATGQPFTTRISICFSDYIDTRTLTADHIRVRRAGGAAVPGFFSYAFNTASFQPEQRLAQDTTYEIVVTTGVRDVMGNAVEQEVLTRFSTGDEVVVPPPPEGEDAGVGGSGGTGLPDAGADGTGGGPMSGGVGGSGGGTGGSGATSGGAGGTRAPNAAPSGGSEDGDCGCRTAPSHSSSTWTLCAAFVALALGGVRRSSRARA